LGLLEMQKLEGLNPSIRLAVPRERVRARIVLVLALKRCLRMSFGSRRGGTDLLQHVIDG
jgi:hypothetical protein